MITRRNILLTALFIAVLLCPPSANAGGRTKEPEQDNSSPPILFNTWHKENVIHIAFANISETDQSFRAAVGMRDVHERISARRSFEVPAFSIGLTNFALPGKRKAGFSRRNPDIAFVEREGPAGARSLDFMAVQNLPGTTDDALLDSYIGASGGVVVVRYLLQAQDRLRIIIVPKTVDVEKELSMKGRTRQGSFPAASRQEIGKLNIPAEYRRQVAANFENNYVFIIRKGFAVRIAIEYAIPEIKNCALVRIADYRYFFTPEGGVSEGGGSGAALMVYNPAVMKMIPLPSLVPEDQDEGVSKQK